MTEFFFIMTLRDLKLENLHKRNLLQDLLYNFLKKIIYTKSTSNIY